MKTAVLVIDVQEALSTGEYGAYDAANVIARINAVTGRARAADLPVILIQHEETTGPLQLGSPGWQLAGELAQKDTDIRLRKTATDSFHRTDLDALLKGRGIERLVICGFQSEFCVDTSTRRALALGYEVLLVADGHSTLDNEVFTAAQILRHHNATLANISSFGPRAHPLPAAEISFEP
jgi:nicotinamidase-related amidase